MTFAEALADFELNRVERAAGDNYGPTLTDEHFDKAIEQVCKDDPDFVADTALESAFWKEHFGRFAANDKLFRSELRDKQRVVDLATEIAENEAKAAREQFLQDQAEAAFEDGVCSDNYQGDF